MDQPFHLGKKIPQICQAGSAETLIGSSATGCELGGKELEFPLFVASIFLKNELHQETGSQHMTLGSCVVETTSPSCGFV